MLLPWVILLMFLTFAAVFSFGQQKYALVIGNGDYSNFGSLRNPMNDANDIAETLEGLGFSVERILNGNLQQMENAVLSLRSRLAAANGSAPDNDVYGFFYYAGHGVQMEGQNFLIPVDANIPDRYFLRDRAMSLQVVLDLLNDAGNTLNMVVLDACRDFPAAWSRSLNRGLAVIHPHADKHNSVCDQRRHRGR